MWYIAHDIEFIHVKEVIPMKFVCQLCGYVYDEAAEGTKFEDLPDDYVCPICGAGKDQFTPED